MSVNPLEAYLKECRDIRATGAAVAETSFYPALSNLFNEIGKTLKPKVRCVINIANRGAGLPDGGFFTANQFRKATDADPKQGQLPARGVLEVKSPAEDVRTIAQSEQVKRYNAKYGLVLVTNYREFLLLGRDAQGNPFSMEGFSLADSESSFWTAAVHHQKTAKELGERFCEYLKRVMLASAPLSAPQEVAWFLASYARDAKARIDSHKDLSALAAVRNALEEALGMKFTGERGEHFFRSTLIQTLFYGVFSAWVLWHRERPDRTDSFDWRVAEWSLRVPFIRALYEEVATPSKLGPLGLVEVLDWTAGVLNRVERTAFFQQFQEEHAVQYFYEPFLEAFDPELRKDLGIWYTPPEIIKYQVERVDTVLREELDLADGLADPNVIVLDPCCGTGGYLIEVLKRIADTLKGKDGDALLAADLKKAAMTRVFGFEILPAPFVVAHLQLGLMLHRLGAPLSVKANERVGVYLTNALTGWEAYGETPLSSPELEQERKSSGIVKRESSVLVILGNPPYNAFAGVSPEEERGLVEPYKGLYYKDEVGKGKKNTIKKVRRYKLSDPENEGGWGIKKFNLDDLYVRFFRLAERRIAEMTGKGIISFISNFSYLSDPSFVIMRQRFLNEFDQIWIDCMNGDSRETGKLTPEGKPDPSVFSTEYNKQGIRVGTAICVIVRKQPPEDKPVVRFRHFWGVTKRQDLLVSLAAKDFYAVYTRAKPSKENRYSFRPGNVSDEYNTWPRVRDLCMVSPSNGLMEKRGGALIDVDKDALAERMQDYFNLDLSWDDYRAKHVALTEKRAGFSPRQARKIVLAKKEEFAPARLVRYAVRPLDVRWCYYTQTNPIWNRARPFLWEQCFHGNAFLVARPAGVAVPEGSPMFFTRLLGDNDFQRGHSYYFPFLLASESKNSNQEGMFKATTKANLSTVVRTYLTNLGIKDPDVSADDASLVWMHALAIGYSPLYLAENTDGIRQNWPRVPLPDSRKTLEASAKLGRRIAALLDTEKDVDGVTSGTIDGFLRTVAVLSRVGGGELDPDAGDLAITGGWGHTGKGSATMPGKGQIVQRPYEKAELQAIGKEAKARGLSVKQVLTLLGPDTRDVYLSDKAYWRNIPSGVWEYYIGGYQVIKKWLSYREQKLLDRALKAEEAREVTSMAQRLAVILLLQPALDKNYRRVKANAYAWPRTTA